MASYDAVEKAFSDHTGIQVGSSTVTMLASQLRKLAPGMACIDQAAKWAGIARVGKFIPSASDAPPCASLDISAPETDAERAIMAAALISHLRAHPRICGSSYDPAFAAQWAAYRSMMAEIA